MSREVQQLVRLLKDSQNRYLWSADGRMGAGLPAQLLGYDVLEFNDMPQTLSTSATTYAITFANWPQFTVQLTVLVHSFSVIHSAMLILVLSPTASVSVLVVAWKMVPLVSRWLFHSNNVQLIDEIEGRALTALPFLYLP